MYLLGENEYLIGSSTCVNGMCGLGVETMTQVDSGGGENPVDQAMALTAALNPSPSTPASVVTPSVPAIMPGASSSDWQSMMQSSGVTGGVSPVSAPVAPVTQPGWAAVGQQASDVWSSIFGGSTQPATPAKPAAPVKPSAPAAAVNPVGSIFSFLSPLAKAVSEIPSAITAIPGEISSATTSGTIQTAQPLLAKAQAAQAKQAAGKQLTPAEAILLSTGQMAAAAQGYATAQQQATAAQKAAGKNLTPAQQKQLATLQQKVAAGQKLTPAQQQQLSKLQAAAMPATTFIQQPRGSSLNMWVVGGVAVAGLAAAFFIATARKR